MNAALAKPNIARVLVLLGSTLFHSTYGYFYEYEPPRPLGEIETEIRDLEEEIRGMLEEVL
jgi:hypothetical protein